MGASLRKLTSLSQLMDMDGRKLLKTHTGKHPTADVATTLYVEMAKEKVESMVREAEKSDIPINVIYLGYRMATGGSQSSSSAFFDATTTLFDLLKKWQN